MALYEITQDCRIANKDYVKGDVVSDNEVGGFFPTVMKPTNWTPAKVEKKVVEAKVEKPVETPVESEEVEEKVEEKPVAKKQRKKK